MDINNEMDMNYDGEIDNQNIDWIDVNTADISANDDTNEVSKATALPWFAYLQKNGYIPQDAAFDTYTEKNKTLTRASVTPYLLKYAQLEKLTLNESESCNFPDIGSQGELLQQAIKITCQYSLMRGSQGEFLPEQPLKKYELLTILVRSKFGKLEETTQPRYNTYIQKAQAEGMIKNDIQTTNREEGVTLMDLGKRLYQRATVNK